MLNVDISSIRIPDKEQHQVPKLPVEPDVSIKQKGEAFTDDASDDDEDTIQFERDERIPLSSISTWYPRQDRMRQNECDKDDLTPVSIFESARSVLEEFLWKEREQQGNGAVRLESVDRTMLHVSCAKLLLNFDTSIRM